MSGEVDRISDAGRSVPRFYTSDRPRSAESEAFMAQAVRERHLTEWADENQARFDALMHNTRCEVIHVHDDFWLKCWECLYALQSNGDAIEILKYAERLPHNPSPEQIMHTKITHLEYKHA